MGTASGCYRLCMLQYMFQLDSHDPATAAEMSPTDPTTEPTTDTEMCPTDTTADPLLLAQYLLPHKCLRPY